MNAKKIMGAVLVALLAAALFVGAGAADDKYYGTYFIYQNVGQNVLIGDWSSETGESFDLTIGGYVPVVAEGKYNNATGYIYVKKATAPVSGILMSALTSGNEISSIIGGTVQAGQYVKFAASTNAAYQLYFTNPDNVGSTYFAGNEYSEGSVVQIPEDIVAGTWTVQVLFLTQNQNQNQPGIMADITPIDYRLGQTYTFTIEDDSKKVELDKDTVLKNNAFFVTITGTPDATVYLTSDAKSGELKVPAGQLNAQQGGDLSNIISVKLGESGQAVVGVDALVDGKYTITVYFAKDAQNNYVDAKTAKITVNEGEITAAADADFYYLGNDVTISGTNTESKIVYFYIKGSNVPFQNLSATKGGNALTESVKADKTWEIEIDGPVFKNFDAGTYTIYAVAEKMTAEDILNADLSDYTYASVAVALKQPFITATLSSSVVAQGSELVVTGTAEAADTVIYYVFGNNKFESGTIAVDDDGTFEKEIDITESGYATGQYFLVIQHHMYDGVFNIGPLYVDVNGNIVSNSADYVSTVGKKLDANIVLNTTGSYAAVTQTEMEDVTLFNTGKRQSSNAAEALCQALDTQNIDDLYVKASFVVAQPTATINPVDDVAKGAKLVVSGTSNMAPGTIVTVEMLSTAFAAIPKESVNSASFIT